MECRRDLDGDANTLTMNSMGHGRDLANSNPAKMNSIGNGRNLGDSNHAKWIRGRMKGKWIEISTPINKLAIASVIRYRQMEFCWGFHCRSGDSDEDLYPEMNLIKRAIWFLLCWMNSTENGEAQKTSQRISEYLREELPEGLSSRCTVNRGIETHNMRPVKWESMSTLCAAVA